MTDWQKGYAAGLAARPSDDLTGLRVVENCIAIVQQSLDTVRANGRGTTANSPYINASMEARHHVIRLLTGYRDQLAAKGGTDDR